MGLVAMLYRARRASRLRIAAMVDPPPPTPYTGPTVAMRSMIVTEQSLLDYWQARRAALMVLRKRRRAPMRTWP